MSHEIRTPITAVLGFTELLLRGVIAEEDDRTRYLQTIHSNGTHLLNLLNDILDLSKIEAERIECERVACEPVRLVADAVSSLRSKAIQKGIELDLAFEGDIPETILSDPTRLRQVVTNLIGNAIKFTDHGSVRVALGSPDGDPANELLRISIRDSGIGMSPEQLARVGEPFTQADTSTTRKYGGTGLGLAISKRLTQLLGGSLEVSSQLNEGTTIDLTFLVQSPPGTRRLDPAAASELLSQPQRPDFQQADLQGVRVLVVDDGETNRELVKVLLGSAGADIVTAENGKQAVEQLVDQALAVDVVLMDMQMPVMDGYTAASELRAAGYRRPVIAMTANAMAGDDQRCRDAGCTDYIAKPIHLDRLLEMVASYAGRTVTAKTDPASPAPPSSPQSGILPADWLREFACELIDRVSGSLPDWIEACGDGNFDEIAKQAHSLKGTGGTVGLEPLSALAETCEHAARDHQVDRILETIQEIQAFVDEANRERQRCPEGDPVLDPRM